MTTILTDTSNTPTHVQHVLQKWESLIGFSVCLPLYTHILIQRSHVMYIKENAFNIFAHETHVFNVFA